MEEERLSCIPSRRGGLLKEINAYESSKGVIFRERGEAIKADLVNIMTIFTHGGHLTFADWEVLKENKAEIIKLMEEL